MSMGRQRKGFTLVAVVVLIALMALLGGLLLSALSRGHSREYGRIQLCKSNIKQLGLAMSLYSSDFGGVYPTCGLSLTVGKDNLRGLGSLCLLYPDYVNAKKIFRCASTKDDPCSAEVGLRIDPILGLITAQPAGCSYAYDSQKPPQADPGTAIAADRHDPKNRLRNSPNHGNTGQNVLYYDGHVEWGPTPRVSLDNDHIWAHWDYRPGPNVLACSDSYITQ